MQQKLPHRVIQIKGEDWESRLGRCNDIFFTKHIRNSADILLSSAFNLVKALRVMKFQPDQEALSNMLTSEGLEDSQEMRDSVLKGIKDAVKDIEANRTREEILY